MNDFDGVRGLLQSLEGIDDADIVHLRTPLDPESCRVLRPRLYLVAEPLRFGNLRPA